ncbi:MAG TPA: AlkA N-terminal domain-containing protein [Vicinamibacteria bacterium]|nr:AlkA N-terminal domain-containing protein [Vicinamibacteria bacterium]
MDAILGLDRRALDRARASRDPRFDGKFFIAVTSTRIYCRPVCPVPSPKVANIRYYATAASAAEAGYRPCLRCRPEAAPGTPAWLGTSAVVRRALQLIHEGALDASSVEALAARVGIGPRHLHRLFVQHVGASPIVVAQTRRLHFAKRLLDETSLRMTEIALASGFGSLRRFNHAFQATYRRAPRDLRRQRRDERASDGGDVVLRLAYRPPYDWEHVRGFLATRALPGVERVDDRGYARTVVTPGGHAIVCVRPLPGEHALELRVRGAAPAALFQLSSTARRAFDLAADPARIALALRGDARLGPLVARHPGLRIPGAWDPFECAVRAVLGQQVSVAAGRTLAARLVARVGCEIEGGSDGLTHVFPTPAALAAANLDGLGLPGARVRALQSLAAAAARGALDFSAPAEEVARRLEALPGFGPWTAQYVALRGLGEPDAFPAADLVLRRAAAGAAAPLTAAALEAQAEAWRPWRGYAVLHLWRAAGEVVTARPQGGRRGLRS